MRLLLTLLVATLLNVATATSLRKIFKSNNIDLEVVGIDQQPQSPAFEQEGESFLETEVEVGKKRTSWKLIMVTSKSDSQLAYGSSHWQSTSTVAGTSQKMREFKDMPFKKIKFCVTSKKNCYTYKSNRVWNSARQLFSAGWQKVDLDQKKIDKVFGRRTTKGTDCGMIRWGFNVQCRNSKARFGYCSNPNPKTGCKSEYGSKGVRYAKWGAYLGCFRDTGRRDLPWHYGWWYQRSNCNWWAWRNRAAYYGLQWWGQCFVGRKYGKYGKANNCNTPCRWNRRQTCGGGWANSVYIRDTEEDGGAIGVGLYTKTGGDRGDRTEHMDSGWTSGFEKRYNGQEKRGKTVYIYALEHKLCSKNNGGCDTLTQCSQKHDGTICGPCPTGYTGNGYDGCKDINECLLSTSCDTRTRCKNAQGTFSCSPCPKGFSGTGKEGCKDINECDFNNGGCDSKTRCTNKEGSRDCSECPRGWLGNGAEPCVDKNECWAPKNPCAALTECINKKGTYTCGECPKGYTGDGMVGCTDIDECTHHNGLCDPLTKCSNTKGSYDCGACPDGYKGDGKKGCDDIDECKRHNGGCDPQVLCINTRGSRTCGPCPNGYSGSGLDGCTDIDECLVENGGCDSHVECVNTLGSRECGNCPRGWSGSGYTECKNLFDDTKQPFEKLNDMVDRVVKKATDTFGEKRKQEYEEKSLQDLQDLRKNEEEKRLKKMTAEAKDLAISTAKEMKQQAAERQKMQLLRAKEAEELEKATAAEYKAKVKNATMSIYNEQKRLNEMEQNSAVPPAANDATTVVAK